MTRSRTRASGPSAVDLAIRLALVGLTFATAYIHSTLGGADVPGQRRSGSPTLGVAMLVPVGLAIRYRDLIQLALGGFAAATIGGWLLFGARYSTGYIATTIEIAVVALVIVATYRAYGGPVAVARSIVARVSGPSSAGVAA